MDFWLPCWTTGGYLRAISFWYFRRRASPLLRASKGRTDRAPDLPRWDLGYSQECKRQSGWTVEKNKSQTRGENPCLQDPLSEWELAAGGSEISVESMDWLLLAPRIGFRQDLQGIPGLTSRFNFFWGKKWFLQISRRFSPWNPWGLRRCHWHRRRAIFGAEIYAEPRVFRVQKVRDSHWATLKKGSNYI